MIFINHSRKKLVLFGIATAFEEFEYNNDANLKLLLDKGTLVGATKKYYNTNFGISNYLDIPKFPIAFDRMTSSEELINSNKIDLICSNIPNFTKFSETEKEILLQKIKSYYAQLPVLAETFTLNQLQGTPSFVIFDDKYDIQALYFGHQNVDFLKIRLEDLLG